MKRITFIMAMVSISLLSLTGCKSKEFTIKVDDKLQAVEIDDNYKTYYEIFVHSFSDSNDDGIGDLQGLINRLDYLNDGDKNSGKSLGVDGIWLMPIMKANSYHKYDVRNYESIDPEYGSLETFDKLIEECNKRKIDVIIDLVINHTSNVHSWFNNAKNAIKNNQLDNKYISYYNIVKAADREAGLTYYELSNGYYYEANFSSSMPELNFDNEEVKEEIKSIIKFWFDRGVKGFRLDAIKYVYLGNTDKNIEFWKWFNDECKKIKEDCYLVGEDWSGDAEIKHYYQALNCFDFGMSESNGAVAMAVTSQDEMTQFTTYLERYQRDVLANNKNAILNPFLSNHDQNRSAGYFSVEDYSAHMAANLYLLSSGNPFIYYGEEIGMKGSRGSESTDANRRLAMLWGDKDTVKDPIGASYDRSRQTNGTLKSQLNDEKSLYNHYKKVIILRNANPEIARGIITAIDFESYDMFGGFLSVYNGSTVGVFHNNYDDKLVIDLSEYTDFEFNTLRGFVGKGDANLTNQILTISGKTSVILK